MVLSLIVWVSRAVSKIQRLTAAIKTLCNKILR